MNTELTEDQMNEIEMYLTQDEYKLYKLIKEHDNIMKVLEMIYKQSMIKPSSISSNTVDTMGLYVNKIEGMDAEIKTILLRNTHLLPEGINISNYDEWQKRGGQGVCNRWDVVNGGFKR